MPVSSQLKVSSGVAPKNSRTAGMPSRPKSALAWFASPPSPHLLRIFRSCLRQKFVHQPLLVLKCASGICLCLARTSACSLINAYVRVPWRRKKPLAHCISTASNSWCLPSRSRHLPNDFAVNQVSFSFRVRCTTVFGTSCPVSSLTFWMKSANFNVGKDARSRQISRLNATGYAFCLRLCFTVKCRLEPPSRYWPMSSAMAQTICLYALNTYST